MKTKDTAIKEHESPLTKGTATSLPACKFNTKKIQDIEKCFNKYKEKQKEKKRREKVVEILPSCWMNKGKESPETIHDCNFFSFFSIGDEFSLQENHKGCDGNLLANVETVTGGQKVEDEYLTLDFIP